MCVCAGEVGEGNNAGSLAQQCQPRPADLAEEQREYKVPARPNTALNFTENYAVSRSVIYYCYDVEFEILFSCEQRVENSFL